MIRGTIAVIVSNTHDYPFNGLFLKGANKQLLLDHSNSRKP